MLVSSSSRHARGNWGPVRWELGWEDRATLAERWAGDPCRCRALVDVEEVRGPVGLAAQLSLHKLKASRAWLAFDSSSGSDCDDATARRLCHAPGGDEMTLALVTLVNDVDLSPTPGLSVRAARAVLRAMARVAGDDGQFRYGMRQAKVAALAEYSAATIKRAQRFWVERGLLERVAVGGGRCSTRWRICVERLRPASGPAAPVPPALAPPPPRPGSPRASRWASAIQQLGRGEPALGHAQIFSKSYTPSGPAEPVTEVCQHGQRAGLMPTKALPWCPVCRRLTRKGRSLRR